MFSNTQRFEERLEEELAKIDPKTLQYLDQLLAENAPAVNQFLKKRRRVCKSHYFRSLTSQEPLHAKEGKEEHKGF